MEIRMGFASYIMAFLWMLPLLVSFFFFCSWAPHLTPYLVLTLVLCGTPLAIILVLDRRKGAKKRAGRAGD